MTNSPSILGAAARTAADVAGEIRRDFDHLLESRYGTVATPDPALSVLFHALGEQVARVYVEAEQQFPVAVLDDLLAGLGMPPRLALPAQTVVAFERIERRERVTPETGLCGYLRSGEPIPFSPDVAIDLAPTQLVFAAVYERGRLQTLPGARLPGGQPVPPASIALDLPGAAPMIFLAFDPDEAHLSHLGLYIETTPDGAAGAAIRRSPWQQLTNEGRAAERGTLRATSGRGGVRQLAWSADPGRHDESGALARALPVSGGAYGQHVWVLPRIPVDRRWRCTVPPALGAVASRLLPAESAAILDRPLAWVQIPLPAGTADVASAVQQIRTNCVTASNVQVWSETVAFPRMGTAIALRPEGDPDQHLMGVLSVVGEAGEPYVEESDVQASSPAGRYRYRAGQLELWPAQRPSGRSDSHAVLRLLFCDGAKANGVDVGDVCAISAPLANVTAGVTSLTVARGGSAPPAYAPARVRFAELLRTRERVVTPSDVDLVVRSFESRVRSVRIEAACEPVDGVVRRMDRVTVGVGRCDFSDPEAELVRLRDRLEQHLAERALLGQRFRVLLDVEA